MIVVAIIGVLAALAIYGVRRYLTSAKTSEARNNLGAIARGASAAFNRETAPAEDLPDGAESSGLTHSLCGDASVVPVAVPKGNKYQPITENGKDFETTDAITGWKCVRFRMSQPHYYQYQYHRDTSPVAPNNPAVCAANCFEAGAVGDLDGDNVPALFALTGHVNVVTKKLKLSSSIYVEQQDE